ncbi:MAG: C25 family cysteine peptidase [Bacteroidota bacterium]|nr:C25 family cysteine peptidase [Bacteroidota bacterium]
MRKNIFLITIITLASFSLFSQSTFIPFSSLSELVINKDVSKNIDDSKSGEIIVEYQIPGAYLTQQQVGETIYKFLSVEGFSKLHEVGKAALPFHNDLVAIPHGAEVKITILKTEFREYNNILIHPALQPATDTYGAPEPEFEIDEEFYSSDILYPKKTVLVSEIAMIRGLKTGIIQFCPVQYNPAQRKVIVYSSIKYKIEFSNSSSFINKKQLSKNIFQKLPQNILNNKSLSQELISKTQYSTFRNTQKRNAESKNYIIITHDNYKEAADSLANWKRQLGYSVDIISKAYWNSSDVKNEIKTRYENWTPKPDYFVIIGDNEDVPGENLTSPNNNTYASDHYYACLDGSSDFYADMGFGRISVSSSYEAMNVIQKIINYERFPVKDSIFYSTGLNCAQYQDDNNDDYADRRFSLTSENVKDYMTDSIGFSVKRIYASDPNVTPTYWNNTAYANGEALDSSLLKPTFAWDGDKDDIANEINAGALYVLHRDHGYAGGSGWHMPKFLTYDVNSKLSNGNKVPVVFSINCHTGEYQVGECFAEAFLRHQNGGAVGVFAAAYYSYSGYNDALSLGFFDAIWANPGLVPNFTGTGGINNPSLTAHDNITTMGDVLNQGLIRMTETWGTSKYTNELFHYFGDPAMRLWTDIPVSITASHIDSIICNSTTFLISNSSCKDGIATLISDGVLLDKIQLVNGNGTFSFDSIAGENAILTISKPNHQPYIATIKITGGCPKAKFLVETDKYCIDNPLTITDKSSGNISNYYWNFGTDALPASANTAGPHDIIYTSEGSKNITLTIDGPMGTNTYRYSLIINKECEFYMPKFAGLTINRCKGVLYDDGGENNYSNQKTVYTTINPSNAKNITLNFNSFAFEDGFDSLIITDGRYTSSPIIGSYTGFNLPNGGQITSTGNAITLIQMTDPALNMSGFKLHFSCNYENTMPNGDFTSNTEQTCNGLIRFKDWSSCFPESWIWDFGDGDTSHAQNPEHIYSTSGTYTVKLYVSNTYGTDTIIKEDLITVNFPKTPIIHENDNCGDGYVILSANGDGTIEWYDTISGGNLVATGETFITPYLDTTTTYFVQTNATTYYTGPKTNQFGTGSYFNYNNQHGLLFNCYKALTLKKVTLYAQGAAYRVIQLQTNDGIVLQDTNIYLEDGENRVSLNFDVPVASNLKLLGPGNPNLYRNRSGANYPYEIPGVLSITSSTASSSGYYYYFYNWELSENQSCISERIPITATIRTEVATADFSYIDNDRDVTFTNLSTNIQSSIWDFGDGNYDSVNTNTQHYYQADGEYTVILTIENACGNDDISKTINVVNSINENLNKDLLKIFPNPNNGNFVIEYNGNNVLEYNIIDMNGKVIVHKKVRKNFSKQINSENFTEGLYFIKLTTKEGIISKKIVVIGK